MYKVLRKKNGRLLSCIMSRSFLDYPWRRWWSVRYIPQTWVKAKKGKLFVCKSLRSALRFYDTENGHEIWECETKNAEEFSHVSMIHRGMFREFWKNNDKGFKKLTPYILTYGADEVKLTKRVWPK